MPRLYANRPAWGKIDVIRRNGAEASIAWITVSRDDEGADAFVKQYDLPAPAYAIPTEDVRQALGVAYWPLVYLIDGSGLILDTPGWVPTDIESIPAKCRS